VLGILVSKDLLSPQVRDKILSWRHTGFNVHSKVRAATRRDARRVARYMAKPILALAPASSRSPHPYLWQGIWPSPSWLWGASHSMRPRARSYSNTEPASVVRLTLLYIW
jgi:hypothetical protein